MVKSKQQIIDEVSEHIRARGGAASDWYVGTSACASASLFTDHKVKRDGDRWIHRRAGSPEAAREIQVHFVKVLATDGRIDAGGSAGDRVYAYRKAPHTTP